MIRRCETSFFRTWTRSDIDKAGHNGQTHNGKHYGSIKGGIMGGAIEEREWWT